MSWERHIIFLWNKQILNLCLKWHILRSYHFVEEVNFKFSLWNRTLRNAGSQRLSWGFVGAVMQRFSNSNLCFPNLKPDSYLSKKLFHLLQWKPFKMMKNAFYFMFKTFFVLKIFKVLCCLQLLKNTKHVQLILNHF